MSFAVARWAVGIVIFSALAAGSGYAQAAPPLLLTFENESGHPDADVYIGFVGGGTLSATNVATRAPLALSQFGSEHWYTLDTLPAGIDLAGFSGRLYIGYGSPWNFVRAGYEPSPSASTDPNYLKRYDKVEITYFGKSSDVANATSIDYFSIPVGLNAYRGGTTGTLQGSVTGSATNVIQSALGAVTAVPDAAVVRDGIGNFVRVIGATTYPPSPGLPASPYDTFDDYLSYLRNTYAPAHGNVVAAVKGAFAGVDPPTTPATKPQAYDFTATVDAQGNITLAGSGSVAGRHTLLLKHADLVAPTGIYGANPFFYFDGQAKPINPQNDLYGWLIGDLLAGLNIGAVGSTVPQNTLVRSMTDGVQGLAVSLRTTNRGRGRAGTLSVRAGDPVVGEMDSQDWFKLTTLFSVLQPGHTNFYNQWAATMAPISQAYNFAYSDRFAHVVAPLNPTTPQFVDTLQVVFLSEHATPVGIQGGAGGGLCLSCHVEYHCRGGARCD